MPQAVAVAVADAVATEGATAAVYAAVYVAAYAATAYAISKASQSLARKPGKGGPGSGLEIAVIDTTADGRIIYGSIRTSGINVIPALASNNAIRLFSRDGSILTQVLALAIHEVDSFGSWNLDDDVVTQGEISAITGTLADGKVTGTSKYKNAAWLRGYTGTASQNVDFILNSAFPTNFTSSFKGRGIAYVAASFDWGKGKVYTGGVPNIAVMVNGKKCYDPRLDSSPGNAPTNATYCALTSNPALIWADYKINAVYGQAVDAADIDWTCVVNAANDCDALVAIPGATTQKRYTFNGVMSCNEDVGDNEKNIVDAMMGKLAFSGGLWRIFAGTWRAAEFAITREDWVSISTVQSVGGKEDKRYNGAVVYHVDEARKYQRVESYRRVNDTYKTADGNERIWIEMDQPFTLTGFEAQRKGEFLLRQSRNGVTFAGKLPPRFMKLRTWDNVTLTFEDLGWVSKIFTVAGCTPSPDGSIDVVLVEEQQSDWTDLLDTEYDNPSISAIPDTNPTTPTEPDNITASGLPGQISFAWDDPIIKPLGTRYRILMANTSILSAATPVWDGMTNNAVVPIDPDIHYWWVQAYANSYYGLYQPNSAGTLYRALPIDDSTFSQRLLIDEEFEYDIGSRHWYQHDTFVGSAGGLFVGSFEIVPDAGNAQRGVFRAHCAPNSLSIFRLEPKRTPPQVSQSNQVYGFYVRFRRATGVTTGTISIAVTHANSTFTIAPNSSTGAAVAAGRADNRDTVNINVGSGFGADVASTWFSAQGHLIAPSSSFASFPYLEPRVIVRGIGGDIDIDKIGMWVANSTGNTGSYYFA